MEQLELFNPDNYSNATENNYLGNRDWEIDSQQNLFDNTQDGSHNQDSSDDKDLFDNTNNLTELAVSEYSPGGTAARGNYYYRFSYREGRRVKHIHIKGGHTGNKLAIKRKGLVEAWIRENIPLEKIIEWIREW